MYPRPRNADQRFAGRAHYMPKHARSVLEHSNGSAVYVYETAGRFYAVFFWGTAGKPANHYRYRSEAERDKAIWEFRESVERSAAFKADLRVKRQTALCTLKPGDIVNTSWGYDQTNVDWPPARLPPKTQDWAGVGVEPAPAFLPSTRFHQRIAR